LATSTASADEPKSLDAQLLEGLDDDLLKGLPAATRQPDAALPAVQTQPAVAATNPLAQIAERMRLAQKRIAERDTTADTQQLQKQIQDDLAALIEAAKKQCAACNKPGSGQGQQAGTSGGNPVPAPPRDSTNRVEQGTKESLETADVADVLRRFWGHLPDKLREQMQASLSEQFLPKYERLIEDYYKRLAEEGRGRP
jgi:cell pole-organizing protein PopZ